MLTDPVALAADVVIVGGGIAGCVAALRAADSGASVVVVDKVRSIRRSGDAGRGVGFLTTYLGLGETWDTPQAFADWYVDIGEGLVDMAAAGPLAIEPLPAVCALLDDIGVPLHDDAGRYDRSQRMWAPGPIVVKFDGSEVKPRLADRVLSTPAVQVVSGVHVTSVVTHPDGRIGAVTGFDIRSGAFVVIEAPAVVLATGSAERVSFNSPRRDPFNTYHVPFHGATGFALAARAGATLANIEFLGTFLFPRGFATGAMGILMESGARLINGNGDLVSDLVPPSESAFGHGLIGQAVGEARAGRGPLYLDCTHLAGPVIDGLRSSLKYDAPLFFEFLDQSGIDLTVNPLEMEPFTGAWSATGSPKGVVVDGRSQTAVPGLFAAGDLATPVYALAGSLTSGYVAGAEAAGFAGQERRSAVAGGAIEAERERTFAALQSSTPKRGGIHWREFERELQLIMTQYVGMDRNANGLRAAAAGLGRCAEVADQVRAADPHELMRAHEALDLCFFDSMMTAAATERDETRFNFVIGHRRSDFPETDDTRWKGVAVTVSHGGRGPVVDRWVPNPWWRSRHMAQGGADAAPN